MFKLEYMRKVDIRYIKKFWILGRRLRPPILKNPFFLKNYKIEVRPTDRPTKW